MVLSCQLGAHLLLQPQGTPTLRDPMAGGCSPWKGQPAAQLHCRHASVHCAHRGGLAQPLLSSVGSANTPLGWGLLSGAGLAGKGVILPFRPPPRLTDHSQGLLLGFWGHHSWLFYEPH